MPRRRTAVCFSRRRLCRRRGAPEHCFCRNTPGPYTVPSQGYVAAHSASPVLRIGTERSSATSRTENCARSTRLPALAPATRRNLSLHHIPGQSPLTACTTPSDGGALCTVLGSSEYPRAHDRLVKTKEASRRLAQKQGAAQKHDLHEPFSSASRLCSVERLGHLNAQALLSWHISRSES